MLARFFRASNERALSPSLSLFISAKIYLQKNENIKTGLKMSSRAFRSFFVGAFRATVSEHGPSSAVVCTGQPCKM